MTEAMALIQATSFDRNLLEYLKKIFFLMKDYYWMMASHPTPDGTVRPTEDHGYSGSWLP